MRSIQTFQGRKNRNQSCTFTEMSEDNQTLHWNLQSPTVVLAPSAKVLAAFVATDNVSGESDRHVSASLVVMSTVWEDKCVVVWCRCMLVCVCVRDGVVFNKYVVYFTTNVCLWICLCTSFWIWLCDSLRVCVFVRNADLLPEPWFSDGSEVPGTGVVI